MLRYKTKSRPGLVALYDIRPGNGAGPFLQPRSPHGAVYTMWTRVHGGPKLAKKLQHMLWNCRRDRCNNRQVGILEFNVPLDTV